MSAGLEPLFAPDGVLDPFIFAVSGFGHGPYVQAGRERGWEVHLKNMAPTSKFDSAFGTANDASDPASGLYFQTQQGLPFALEVGATWQHPLEKVDLLSAYPQFEEFAIQQQSVSWFLSPITLNIFQ